MSAISRDLGTLVTATEAAKMLQDYLQKHNIDPKSPPADHYWATLFGIDKLKALVQEIEDYNATNPEETIDGVRIYRCVSPFEDENGEKKDVESVMLVPALTRGKDLYPVRFEKEIGQSGSNKILENGSPCPPSCGGRP